MVNKMTEKQNPCGEPTCKKDCEVCLLLGIAKPKSSISHSHWSSLS
jgi:hypothetical protein